MMNEPRRLREESGSPLELALLDAGASYRSGPAVRARTLAVLGIASTAALTASTAGGASSAFLTKAGWTKLLAISGLGVSAAVPVGYYAIQQASEPAPLAPVVAAAPVQQPTPRVLPPAEREVAPVTEDKDEPRPLPAPKPEPRAPAASVLTAELGALDAARSRLSAGDGADALALLDDYSRTYPRGRLVLEAEVLRIDALAQTGQKAAATKRAEQFLKRHPKSVLASRVRTYLTD
jgi:hypothetical protein